MVDMPIEAAFQAIEQQEIDMQGRVDGESQKKSEIGIFGCVSCYTTSVDSSEGKRIPRKSVIREVGKELEHFDFLG